MLSNGQKMNNEDGDEKKESFQFETPNSFSKPWQNSDVVLVVEKQEIHSHSNLLGFASPVFQKMFDSTFKEGKSRTVEMKEKKYEAVVNVVKLIYPQFTVSIEKLSMETLRSICDMLKEYMMDSVLKKIEKSLVAHLDEMLEAKIYVGGNKSNKYTLKAMTTLADKHNLHDLLSDCASKEDQYSLVTYNGLSDKAKTKLLVNKALKRLDDMKNDQEKYTEINKYKTFFCSSIQEISNLIKPIKERNFLRDTKRIDS